MYLHVSILVFLALCRSCVVPLALCVLSVHRSRSVRQEERIVELTIGVDIKCLQVLSLEEAVGTTSLASLRADVEVGSLVLVKQVVELVVGALHGVQLLLVLDRSMVVPMRRVVHHHVLVPDVGGALLVTLVVAEGHRHLVHVETPVQVVQGVLLKVVPIVWTHVYVHLHLRVARVPHQVVVVRGNHVVWQQRALVEITSLVHRLLCRGVEFNHHGRVHLGPVRVHGHYVHVVQRRHAGLIGPLSIYLQHVLRILRVIVHVLVDRNVLHVVVVLLLATQGKLRRLVQLVGISFPWDVHHYQVLAHLLKICLACWSVALVLVLAIHTHVAIVGLGIHDTAGVDA